MSHSPLTPEHFKAICHSNTNIQQWLVAYSGGMDSSVMLDLIAQSLPRNSVKVIHFDHGLHKRSNDWAEFCKTQCVGYGFSFECICLNLQPRRGDSIEMLAREHRYFYLKQRIAKNTALLLAHHQQDQAETLLYRLFRGTGIDGLKCMQPCQVFGEGTLLRPLLSSTKLQIEQYAKTHQLQWIEDDSNLSCVFDRNYIRHKILPAIVERWPQAIAKINDLTQLVAEVSFNQQEALHATLKSCLGAKKDQLDLRQIKTLSYPTQQAVLRLWIQQQGYQMPSFEQLQRLQQEVIDAKEGAKPLLRLKNYHFRRYRQTLHLYGNEKTFPKKQSYPWDLSGPLTLQENKRLNVQRIKGQGIQSHLLSEGVTVKQGCSGKQAKKIFQAHGIPPWQRTEYCSVFVGDKLVEIIGLAKIAALQASENEQGILFIDES